MVETNNIGAEISVFDDESTVTQRSHAARRSSAGITKNGSTKTEPKNFYNSVSQTILIRKINFVEKKKYKLLWTRVHRFLHFFLPQLQSDDASWTFDDLVWKNIFFFVYLHLGSFYGIYQILTGQCKLATIFMGNYFTGYQLSACKWIPIEC